MNHDVLDRRGSAQSRRVRRRWLLSRASGFGGDGRSVPCFHCKRRLTPGIMQVDRFPTCGHDGGTYRRENVVPSCSSCNANRCEGCKGFRASRNGALDRERDDPRYDEEY